MPVDPVPVHVIRDGVDKFLVGLQIASLVVTMGAVLLAYLEIRSGQIERRVDFELTVLRQLLIYVARVDDKRVRALASTLQPSVVPITRAAVQLPTTAHGAVMVQRLSLPPGAHPTSYLDGLKDDATSELLDAIAIRIQKREPKGASSRLYVFSDGHIDNWP